MIYNIECVKSSESNLTIISDKKVQVVLSVLRVLTLKIYEAFLSFVEVIAKKM